MIDSMHFDPHIYGRKVFSSSSVQNFCLIFLFLKITRKNEILKPNHTNSTKSLALIIFFLSIWLYSYSRVVFCRYSTHRPMSTVVAILQVNLGFSDEVIHPDQIPVVDLHSK